MEILKGFVFDLQRHDDATIADLTTDTPYLVKTGNDDATARAKDDISAGDTVLAYKNGSTYYVVSETVIGATFTGTVNVATFTVPSAKNETHTSAAGIIKLTDDNTLTTSNAGSVTFADGKVTGLSGTGVVTLAGVISFAGASGTVKTATNGNMVLSGTHATITVANNVISNMTKGTIKTANGFAGTYMDTTVTNGNTLGIASNSDGDVYTIEAITGSQAYGTIGKNAAQWSIKGGTGADTFTTAAAAKGVTLDGGSGADEFTLANTSQTYIVGGAGADTVKIAAALGANSSIFGGAEGDLVTLTAAANLGAGILFDLGEGNDTIQSAAEEAGLGANSSILGGAGKDFIDLSNFKGADATELYVDGGADADNIVGDATKIVNGTVLGGSGSDTIGGFNANVTLAGGEGADYFKLGTAAAGTANASDYKFGEDYLVTDTTTSVTDVNKLATLAGGLTSNGNSGFIKEDASGAATIQGSGGIFAATFVDTNGSNKVNLGWVGENPVTLDASSQDIASVLVGTTNDSGDLLLGGKKADTIHAGAGDSVYGGAGADIVTIKAAGAYVGLSTAGGADEVLGFNTGWDSDSADKIYMMDGSAADLKVINDGTDVSLKSGTATMKLTAKGSATDTKILINGKKVDVIAKGATVTVDDNSTIADYYFGTEASGIDMTDYSGNITVDLSTDMFRNISTLTAGTGNMSVLGGSKAEYLKGGKGATSLYGGAGKDTLVSGEGKTTFFATDTSGNDVVENFVIGTEDNSDVLNLSGISKVTRADSTSFTLKVNDNNSLAVKQNGGDINSNIQWASGEASGVAKIGVTTTDNTFSYDAATTNYIGGNKTDVVSIASGTTDSFNVWLDKTGGTFSSIEVYDFSQTSGDVLAAGKADTKETIVGGQGSSSLWGGAGDTADVLKNNNSSATTEFFYGMGEGNDVINGQRGDSVNLYNISVSDITKAEIGSSNVVFTTTAKNTVTVEGSVGTFKLADGSSWTADYSTKTWKEAN